MKKISPSKEYWEAYPKQYSGNWHIQQLKNRRHNFSIQLSKVHPFSDGNKRIGSFIFVWFLEQNSHHLNKSGQRKINDNTLVTLALAVAQSLPEQREIMQKLIMNLGHS